MTEAEWIGSDDPLEMFWSVVDRASDRKLLLFAVASLRRSADKGEEFFTKLEIAERFADGAAVVDELRLRWNSSQGYAPPERARDWASLLVKVLSLTPDPSDGKSPSPWRRVFVHLLRDIFGNPFRSLTFSPEWRTDTALALARQMYESRDFSAMPILADALQDAGCDNEDILDHCRTEQTHVRGCWVVDLVLGKE
jgi:hypothetical protein